MSAPLTKYHIEHFTLPVTWHALIHFVTHKLGHMLSYLKYAWSTFRHTSLIPSSSGYRGSIMNHQQKVKKQCFWLTLQIHFKIKFLNVVSFYAPKIRLRWVAVNLLSGEYFGSSLALLGQIWPKSEAKHFVKLSLKIWLGPVFVNLIFGDN